MFNADQPIRYAQDHYQELLKEAQRARLAATANRGRDRHPSHPETSRTRKKGPMNLLTHRTPFALARRLIAGLVLVALVAGLLTPLAAEAKIAGAGVSANHRIAQDAPPNDPAADSVTTPGAESEDDGSPADAASATEEQSSAPDDEAAVSAEGSLAVEDAGSTNGGRDESQALAAVNTSPVANADAYSVTQDTTLSVDVATGLLANDTDADGDALAMSIFTGGLPSHGVFGDPQQDGAFTYTPHAGFVGTDSFLYRPFDGTETGNAATVTITVTAAGGNTPPVANDDSFSGFQGTNIAIAKPGVLANDTDADGDPLSLQPATNAPTPHGTVTFFADGAITYTPTAGFVGADAFDYTVADGQGDTATATVTITVAANSAPVARDDAYTTPRDTELTVDAPTGVLATDSDPDGDVSSTGIAQPAANGTVALAGDGSFIYTPNAGFVGTDTFLYAVGDTKSSVIGEVTITVTDPAANTPPVANGDAYGVAEDTDLVVDAAKGVLANDADADGDAVTVVGSTSPAHGTRTSFPNGSFLYTPAAGFAGSDEFTYTVSNGNGGTDTATVAISVSATTPANTPPVANDDAYTTSEATTLTEDAGSGLLANDTDADGDALTAGFLAGPTNGALSATGADGAFTYTPDAGFLGSDSFTYLAQDGSGVSGPATVTVTVTAAPEPSPDPSPSGSPAPSEEPAPSNEPDEEPGPSESPAPSDDPVPSDGPAPSPAGDGPEASPSAGPSATPSETPAPSPNPDADEGGAQGGAPSDLSQAESSAANDTTPSDLPGPPDNDGGLGAASADRAERPAAYAAAAHAANAKQKNAVLAMPNTGTGALAEDHDSRPWGLVVMLVSVLGIASAGRFWVSRERR